MFNERLSGHIRAIRHTARKKEDSEKIGKVGKCRQWRNSRIGRGMGGALSAVPGSAGTEKHGF
jgi:hypothetical protein